LPHPEPGQLGKRTSQPRDAGRWLGRTAVIWGALLAGTIGGGLAMPAVSMPGALGLEPLTPAAALLSVNGACAIMLAIVAANQEGGLKARFAALFALLYGLDTLLPLSEALLFENVLRIPRDLLAVAAAVGFAKALLGAATAVLLFRSCGERKGALRAVGPKLAVAAVLYVALYFAAGLSIAWQSEAVRAFYGEGRAIPSPAALIIPQLVRGLALASISAGLLGSLTGSTARRLLLTATAFGLLMALPLLLPNGAIPWSVRRVHFVELAVSNFLFGLGSTLILTAGPRRSGEARVTLDPPATSP